MFNPQATTFGTAFRAFPPRRPVDARSKPVPRHHANDNRDGLRPRGTAPLTAVSRLVCRWRRAPAGGRLVCNWEVEGGAALEGEPEPQGAAA